jgi:hypothetical protein
LRLRDLRRFCRRPEIGELVVGLLQKPSRLIHCGPVIRIVLLKQRLAFDDAIATRGVDDGDEACCVGPTLIKSASA